MRRAVPRIANKVEPPGGAFRPSTVERYLPRLAVNFCVL
jgi:hypothetical protein